MSDPIGFPGRPSFNELGGVKKDRYGSVYPEQELSLRSEWTPAAWQVAGLGKTGDLVTLVVNAAGQKVSGGEAWNTEDDPAKRVSIDHPATGHFVITCDATYPDWNDVERSVVFTGAQVTPLTGPVKATATALATSATQLDIYLWDAAGDALDAAFRVDIA